MVELVGRVVRGRNSVEKNDPRNLFRSECDLRTIKSQTTANVDKNSYFLGLSRSATRASADATYSSPLAQVCALPSKKWEFCCSFFLPGPRPGFDGWADLHREPYGSSVLLMLQVLKC